MQMNETGLYFGGETLRKLPNPAVLLNEETLPPMDLDPKLILNRPLRTDYAIDYAAFDLIETQLQGDVPCSM